MTKHVIQNTVTNPVTAQKIVSRDRLDNLLINNINKNLIFIYSPPGYGKTCAVRNYIKNQSWKHTWLNATCEFGHIYTFFKYLIISLQSINCKFGVNTIQLIDSRRERFQLNGDKIKPVVSEIIKTFVTEFREVFKEDIIVVIDDLHNIDDSRWVNEAFNSLFDNMPSNLHMILVTRQIPNFNFLPLIEKQKMLKIGMEDLIFRFDEITELLKDVYSIDYSEDGIKLLENNMGGWITGIHLILQSFGKDFSSMKVDLQRIPENIFNLLAGEIFKRLNFETQEFLLLSSRLDSFNEEVCNNALCIKNCGKIINELLSKNIFIQPVPSVNGKENVSTYNYQVLFKTYLDSRFNETFSQEKTNQILRKAAEYYLQKKDLISAINCTIKAKDYKKAIPLIVENFDSLFNKAEFEFLWDWLSELENETEIDNPNIVYYLGALYKYYFGDLQRSLEYMERAIGQFSKSNDENGLVKCHLAKARILLNFGRTQEALSELSGLLNKQTSNENRIHLLYLIAFSHFRNSEYDKTAKYLNESLALSKNSKNMLKQPDTFNLLGHIELIKGDYKQSADYYEKALDGNPNLFNRFETLCNLVLLDSQSGNYDKAGGFLSKIEEMINNFPTPIFKIPYLLSKQGYLFESRKYEENSNVLHEINNIARVMNHKQYIYLSYRLLTDTYYYMKNPDKAKVYFEQASKFLENDNELEKIELSVIKALVWGNETAGSSVEKILLDAYEYYSRNEYTYSKAQVAYRLANYYMKNSDDQKAIKYLEESLNTAAKNGYVSFYVREYQFSKDLLCFAVSNNIKKDFVNTITNYSK